MTADMPLPPGAASCEDPRVSDLGDIVAQCNLSSGAAQAFLYHAATGDLYQLSTSLTAAPGNGVSGNYTGISADGAVLVFDSAASDLVPDDTNSSPDVFVAVPEPGTSAAGLAGAVALFVMARRRAQSS